MHCIEYNHYNIIMNKHTHTYMYIHYKVTLIYLTHSIFTMSYFEDTCVVPCNSLPHIDYCCISHLFDDICIFLNMNTIKKNDSNVFIP